MVFVGITYTKNGKLSFKWIDKWKKKKWVEHKASKKNTILHKCLRVFCSIHDYNSTKIVDPKGLWRYTTTLKQEIVIASKK